MSIDTRIVIREVCSRSVTIVGGHSDSVLGGCRGRSRILWAYRTGRGSGDVVLAPLIVNDVDASFVSGIEPTVIGLHLFILCGGDIRLVC